MQAIGDLLRQSQERVLSLSLSLALAPARPGKNALQEKLGQGSEQLPQRTQSFARKQRDEAMKQRYFALRLSEVQGQASLAELQRP